MNEQVALDFDRQKNPAEHDLAERKQMLEAAEQGFEQTAWKDAWERRMAAEDVAEGVFQSGYRRIEIAEAAAQYKLSDAFIEKLKEERVEHLEERGTSPGRWSSGGMTSRRCRGWWSRATAPFRGMAISQRSSHPHAPGCSLSRVLPFQVAPVWHVNDRVRQTWKGWELFPARWGC